MAVTTYLYDAEGHDREVELTKETLKSLRERHLLWIDVDSLDRDDLEGLAATLELDPASIRSLFGGQVRHLQNFTAYTQFGVDTAPATLADEDVVNGQRLAKGRLGGTRLDFLVSAQWLLTVHDGTLGFIDAFRTADKAETMIGRLTTQDFAATLLDAHLEGFFEEIARIEDMVDRLDEQALTRPSSRTLLGRMVGLRRRVSRLRSLLAAQRGVYYALSRPDLQPVTDSGATPHFQVLASRFERAIDEVEHTRDLVVGSFELFASRAAQQTNELVKVLTYLTAVVGICAAVAGVFGMNFETGFFGTGDVGFYVTIGSLVGMIVIATIVARWRRWI